MIAYAGINNSDATWPRQAGLSKTTDMKRVGQPVAHPPTAMAVSRHMRLSLMLQGINSLRNAVNHNWRRACGAGIHR
ncbi:MAG: hypothetical protein ACLTXH_11905 [Enterobacter hormaechei]